ALSSPGHRPGDPPGDKRPSPERAPEVRPEPVVVPFQGGGVGRWPPSPGVARGWTRPPLQGEEKAAPPSTDRILPKRSTQPQTALIEDTPDRLGRVFALPPDTVGAAGQRDRPV